MHDIVIIGGGHNGLAAAFYLAKAGRRPLVLDRRPVVGGGAVTAEIHPGFKCPRLSHEVLIDAQVANDLQLTQRGVEFMPVPILLCAPGLDAPPLVLSDGAQGSASTRGLSPKDAEAFEKFRRAVNLAASVISSTFDVPPPDIDNPTGSDLWHLLKTGRQFRSLDKRDSYRLLRWLTMPVADVMEEWFESDLLRAALAGPGVSGTMLGPRSAGSAAVMLLRETARHRAGGRCLRVKGGPGALTRAMAEAATAAGAEIRTSAGVDAIVVRDERVRGVVVRGEEISCATVLSGADPKTTLLELVHPSNLDPSFATKIGNYRASGTLAKVNLALAAMPAFQGVSDQSSLAGRIHVGPSLDYLERAFDHVKYGEMSAAPWLDVSIPSVLDDTLAPDGGHVASIYVHYAPHRLRASSWESAKGALLANTLGALETVAPDIRSLVVAAEAITPRDLEADLGLAGGHIFHGELALDQLFTMRPLLGHARYRMPIRGLYLCGAGTHPGGFLTGTSGRLAAQVVLRHAQP